MNTQTNPVDLRFLRDFAKGDTQKIRKYIGIYLKTAPEVVNQLNEMMNSEDLDGIKRAAHSLKSQSKYMGADDLSAIMQEIELKSSESANLDDISDLVDQANSVNLLVNESLNEILEQL